MVGVGVGIAMGKVDLGLVDRLVNFIIVSVVIVVIVVDRLFLLFLLIAPQRALYAIREKIPTLCSPSPP